MDGYIGNIGAERKIINPQCLLYAYVAQNSVKLFDGFIKKLLPITNFRKHAHPECKIKDYCPDKEAAMGIVVVSLPCTVYLWGAFIAL